MDNPQDQTAQVWVSELGQGRDKLLLALGSHADAMRTWRDGDVDGLEEINRQLRESFQEYENILWERTGSLLDLGRVDSEEAFSSETHDPEARWVSVVSRYDYQLNEGESVKDFSQPARAFTAGVQATFIPEEPLPVDDLNAWPPDDVEAWLTPDGVIVKRDIFDPRL